MRALLLLPFCFVIFLTSCGDPAPDNEATTMQADHEDQTKEPTRLLRHVVLFNFNEEATQDTVKKIEQAFAGLADKISEIHDFEWGTNNSPEGLNKGLTHCFFVTFLSEEDRATYLPHPAHKEFVELIGPYVEDVTVVDYWTQ